MFKQLRIIAVFAITNIFLAFSYTVPASQYDAELLALTNAERQNVGLPALTLSSQLGQAAQNHADDMAINNYFSHTGLNGSTPSERVKAVGYDFYYVGENISAGRTTPSDTIRGWMNSQGHRENILNPNYTEIGFGYAYSNDSDYKHYWVQVFGQSTGISTPTVPTPTSLEFKSNAIFDQVEQIYAEYFFPASGTQITDADGETIYYRFYSNLYQAVLATYLGDVWYAFYNEWYRFGTLEEANQLLCNNQCWDTVISTPPLTDTGRIQKTEKTFVDTQTGLEWIANEIINLERDEAIAHCEALNYAGHQDWRLSTNNELSSFIKALDQSSVRPEYLGSFSGCLAGITSDGYIALTSDHVPFAEPINFRGHASVRCVR